MDLSRVTGLTRLMCRGSCESQGLRVGPQDKLPPNLVFLCVDAVLSVQPLLELQRLQHLKLYSCWPSDVEEVTQLSALTRISTFTHLQLGLQSRFIDLGKEVLARLPFLRGIDVAYNPWPPEAILDTLNGRPRRPDPAIGVPALLQLTALQRLKLWCARLPNCNTCRLADVMRSMQGCRALLWAVAWC